MINSWHVISLREILEHVSRPCDVEPHNVYEILGEKWYAKGLYIKYKKKGTEIKAKKLYEVKEEDFVYNRLFAWTGSFALVPNELDGCFVSNEYPTFEINTKKILPKYLLYHFTRTGTWNNALSMSRGVSSISRNRLKVEDFLSMKIRIPSIQEQNLIIGKIDSYNKKINDMQECRQQNIIASDEAIDEIYRKFFLNLSNKYGETKISETELEINPENVDPRKQFGNDLFVYIDVSSVEQKISKISERKRILGVNAPSRAKRKMRVKDVIFGAVRPNLKKCFIVDEKLDGNICSTGFTVFRIKNNKINPEFLKYELLSDYFIDQCIEAVTGTHYPALGDKKLKELKLTLPPISEQKIIVENLDYFQQKFNELKRLQNEAKDDMNNLFPSVLNKAFNGELT